MPVKKQEAQYRYYEIPPNSPLLVLLGPGWIRPYGSEYDSPHFHNLLEIGYCYDGTGNMEYNGILTPYGPGAISVVPPNYLHNTIATPGTKSRWEYLFVDTKSFLKEMYASNLKMGGRLLSRIYTGSLHVRHEDAKEMGDLVLSIADLYRNKGEMYLECARGLLLAMLIQIARQQPDPFLKDDPSAAQGNLSIHEALEYIGDNYQDRIYVSKLASVCHMSETHFRRLFSQHMHMSPLEYVNHVRIEAACKLLRTTNASIRSIASRCGFSTLSTFNRNFNEIIGMPPFQWRKEACYERKLDKQNILLFDGWQ